MLYSFDSIMDTTGRSWRELREIAAQKTPPPKAVLDYFRLTADSSEMFGTSLWNTRAIHAGTRS
jgi:hypothetical protein